MLNWIKKYRITNELTDKDDDNQLKDKNITFVYVNEKQLIIGDNDDQGKKQTNKLIDLNKIFFFVLFCFATRVSSNKIMT